MQSGFSNSKPLIDENKQLKDRIRELEGERKNLQDDKLPHRKMAEVELADAMIRIFDYAGAFGYDLQGAFEEKMQFNAKRKDHTREARASENGKKW